LKPRISSKGAEVKPVNRKKRLRFAENHIDWTINDWSRIVFTDEAKLYPKRTITHVIWSGPRSVRAPPFEESLEDKSINVWGYLRYDGVVQLFRFEGTMEQVGY